MAITAVGSPVSIEASAGGTVSPTTVGDCLIASFGDYGEPGDPPTLSGGGCTWSAALQHVSAGPGNAASAIYLGLITATGSSTLNWTSTVGGVAVVQQFTLGQPAVWTIDTPAGAGTTYGGSNSVTFPSVTPTGASELWIGSAYTQSEFTGTGTGGYTWIVNSLLSYLIMGYNLSVSNPSAIAPTCNALSTYTSASGSAQCFIASPLPYVPPSRRGGMPQAVNRAANWMKDTANGLYAPRHVRERIVIPRLSYAR